MKTLISKNGIIDVDFCRFDHIILGAVLFLSNDSELVFIV